MDNFLYVTLTIQDGKSQAYANHLPLNVPIDIELPNGVCGFLLIYESREQAEKDYPNIPIITLKRTNNEEEKNEK